MRTWFTAKAAANQTADIAIYDEIGTFGVSSGDFRDALAAMGDVKTINLSLNTPGGSVFDGLAIHNMLARHPARVVVSIDGLAASIGSLVAMAGDDVIMPENAMMMIHNPSGLVMGDANDMQGMAEALNKIRDGMVSSYAAKSKMEPDAIVEMMNAETWLTAHEAVAQGFADKVAERAKIAAKFDLSKYTHAPRSAYDPDGDGDDDILECLGYLGMAVDNIADAVGCLTGTGDPDAAEAAAAVVPAVSALHRATQAFRNRFNARPGKTTENPTAVAELGNANVVGAPGKEADPPKAQAEDNPAPTADRQDEMLQICATCELAGFPEMSSQFMRSGKSLSQVQAELRALRADRGRGASYAGHDVSARHAVEDIDAAAARRGWDKAVDRLNARLAE